MREKLLILDGNPKEGSFCGSLADAVHLSAKAAGANVKLVRLSQMFFDPNLQYGYDAIADLEPDLEKFAQALLWCDRFVLVHPLWWGSAPAKLKGVFNRVLRPGFAFHYEAGKPLPIGHFVGRIVEVLITSDTPTWYLHLSYRAAWQRILRKQILEFCGFKVRGIKNIGPIKSSTPTQRAAYLAKANKIGANV